MRERKREIDRSIGGKTDSPFVNTYTIFLSRWIRAKANSLQYPYHPLLFGRIDGAFRLYKTSVINEGVRYLTNDPSFISGNCSYRMVNSNGHMIPPWTSKHDTDTWKKFSWSLIVPMISVFLSVAQPLVTRLRVVMSLISSRLECCAMSADKNTKMVLVTTLTYSELYRQAKLTNR